LWEMVQTGVIWGHMNASWRLVFEVD
jgi:hypothetical protein